MPHTIKFDGNCPFCMYKTPIEYTRNEAKATNTWIMSPCKTCGKELKLEDVQHNAGPILWETELGGLKRERDQSANKVVLRGELDEIFSYAWHNIQNNKSISADHQALIAEYTILLYDAINMSHEELLR